MLTDTAETIAPIYSFCPANKRKLPANQPNQNRALSRKGCVEKIFQDVYRLSSIPWSISSVNFAYVGSKK